MQEELEQRSVTLMVSASKFTGRTLKSAISHFLNYTKHKVQEHKQEKKDVVPHGKQSVKELVGQDAGVNTAELADDADIRAFNRVARKYGVDYAVRKVEKDGKPQFLIFFKGRDSGAIEAAMSEYMRNWRQKGKEEKPSIRKMIAAFREMIAANDKNRAKHKEISR